MSRSSLELVLVAAIFMVLLLYAPDILLAGSGVAWWVARRARQLESTPLARAAVLGGVAARLVLLVTVLAVGARFAGSVFFDFSSAMLLSPALTVSSLLLVTVLTLVEALALGYAVRLIVPRLQPEP